MHFLAPTPLPPKPRTGSRTMDFEKAPASSPSSQYLHAVSGFATQRVPGLEEVFLTAGRRYTRTPYAGLLRAQRRNGGGGAGTGRRSGRFLSCTHAPPGSRRTSCGCHASPRWRASSSNTAQHRGTPSFLRLKEYACRFVRSLYLKSPKTKGLGLPR